MKRLNGNIDVKVAQLFKTEKTLFFIAVAMIVFGIAEVVIGFRHEFFGLVTSENMTTTVIGMGLGLCYLFAGILLLCFNRKTLFIAFILLTIDVLGRFVMMLTGMYSMDTQMQIVGMAGGTTIAIIFAIFVLVKYLKMP